MLLITYMSDGNLAPAVLRSLRGKAPRRSARVKLTGVLKALMDLVEDLVSDQMIKQSRNTKDIGPWCLDRQDQSGYTQPKECIAYGGVLARVCIRCEGPLTRILAPRLCNLWAGLYFTVSCLILHDPTRKAGEPPPDDPESRKE